MSKWDFGVTCTKWSWGLGPEITRTTMWTFGFSLGPWFFYARRKA